MKKIKLMMITLSMMCLMTMVSFGQDTIINKFQTKNMLVMGQIVKPIFEFTVYNDSLIQTIIGGFSFNQYEKRNVPTKTVLSIKLQDISIGDVKIYKFEDSTRSIKITFQPNGKAVVLFRVKDSFSGSINETMYY